MWIRSIYASMARILPILTKEPSGGGSVGSGGQWARGRSGGTHGVVQLFPVFLPTHSEYLRLQHSPNSSPPSPNTFFSPSSSFPFGHAQRLPSLPLCRTVSRACLRGVAASTAHDQRTIPTPPSLLPPAQPNLTPFGVVPLLNSSRPMSVYSLTRSSHSAQSQLSTCSKKSQQSSPTSRYAGTITAAASSIVSPTQLYIHNHPRA